MTIYKKSCIIIYIEQKERIFLVASNNKKKYTVKMVKNGQPSPKKEKLSAKGVCRFLCEYVKNSCKKLKNRCKAVRNKASEGFNSPPKSNNMVVTAIYKVLHSMSAVFGQISKNIKSRWFFMILCIVLNCLFIYSIRQEIYMADETYTNYILVSNVVILIGFLSSNVINHRVVQLFITALYSYMLVSGYTVNMLTKFSNWKPLYTNYLFLFIILVLVYALVKKYIVGVCIFQFLCALTGYVSVFLKHARGNPLFISDLTSIRTALEVSNQYQPYITVWVVLQLTLMFVVPILLYFALRRNEVTPFRFKPLVRVGFVTVCVILLFSFYSPSYLENKGFVMSWWEHKQGTGFFVNTIMEAANFGVDKQDDYSIERIEQIRDENPSTPATTDEQPDIICVMNESFSDLSVVNDFSTNKEYLTFLNKLKQSENCISGNLYVSVFGGNTANSEFEFLTGSTTAIFNYGMIPYNNYIHSDIKTNVSDLVKQGYSTLAFHPWKSSGWNRPNVYNYMGFDKKYFYEDLDQGSIEKIRSYPSDSYNYKKLEEFYNEMPSDKPRFIMNITMQNHGGYDDSGFTPTVKTTTGKEYTKVNQYLSLIDYSDQALEELINHYKEVNRKVIICFFGDHQPKIENAFYNDLYDGADQNDQANKEKKYITPFFIWANYDIPEQHIDKISPNYLFAYLSKSAGLKLTPYQNYLLKLYEKYPVITGVGAIDSDNNYYTADQMNEIDDIKEYYNVIYNQIIDTDNTVEDFFD